MRTLRPVSLFGVVPGKDAAVAGMGWIPHSNLIVVGGGDGFFAIADPLRGRVVRRLYGHAAHARTGNAAGVFTPGFSADGRLMVTGADDGSVRVWAVPSGREVGAPMKFVEDGRGDVGDVSMSPDGREIAVDTPQATHYPGVQIFDVATHRRVAALSDDEDVWDLARFTPDGRYIVGGSWKGWVRLWSTKTWKPATRVMRAHAGEMRGNRSAPTVARSRPGRLPTASCVCGTCRRSARSARRCRACRVASRPAVHARRQVAAGDQRRRARLSVGRAAVQLAAPRVRRRRAHADARRVAGRPARARLRAGLPAVTGSAPAAARVIALPLLTRSREARKEP